MFSKSARDLASLLTALVGYDTKDPVTLEALPFVSHNYSMDLASDWSDWRLGIADRKWFWSLYDDQEDNPDELKMFNHGTLTVARMRDLGASVFGDVHIPSAFNAEAPAPALMGRIIRHEMKTGVRRLFSSLKDSTVKSLEDLVLFNNRHPDLAFSRDNPGQGYLERALRENFTLEEYQSDLKQAQVWGVDYGIDYVLDRYNLDALIVPGWSEMSVFAAWASK
ncbi:hypothetical protein IMSHALPRED_010095 [Imshaugia aleurites]|uniref:Uncharacterized protein n=1 Tax=Imshaugia aleurites TaxID=172621 RepID=A0A8H3G2L3_9LECA|nr:hypothetical protein IMSHALPRED_010095 [Imshaugia aleurites]